MKCIYCESNETNGVLLCYGCQVDLFPLVSAWAYCGACGRELPVDSATCPQCKLSENAAPTASHTTLAEPQTKVAAAERQRAEEQAKQLPTTPLPAPSSQALAVSAPTSPRPGLSKAPLADPVEVARARRFQFRIRFIFALLWVVIMILVLWWVRDLVNQPISPIIP